MHLPELAASFDGHEFVTALFAGYFVQPAWTAVWVSTVALVAGAGIGAVADAAVSARAPFIRWIGSAYLWLFRGTPVIVQALLWYYAPTQLSGRAINFGPFLAGIVALAVNEGAYFPEIFAGLRSSDAHARTSGRLALLKRSALPALNDYLTLLKMTSLLYLIGLPEIMGTGASVYLADFDYTEGLLVVALWYLLLTTAVSGIQALLRDRFGEPAINLGRAPTGALGRTLAPNAREAR